MAKKNHSALPQLASDDGPGPLFALPEKRKRGRSKKVKFSSVIMANVVEGLKDMLHSPFLIPRTSTDYFLKLAARLKAVPEWAATDAERELIEVACAQIIKCAALSNTMSLLVPEMAQSVKNIGTMLKTFGAK